MEDNVERAVKAIIQLLFDKISFDNYENSEETLKSYLLNDKVNDRRRLDLDASNDDDNVVQ